jgi:hypothetical protein
MLLRRECAWCPSTSRSEHKRFASQPGYVGQVATLLYVVDRSLHALVSWALGDALLLHLHDGRQCQAEVKLEAEYKDRRPGTGSIDVSELFQRLDSTPPPQVLYLVVFSGLLVCSFSIYCSMQVGELKVQRLASVVHHSRSLSPDVFSKLMMALMGNCLLMDSYDAAMEYRRVGLVFHFV